MSFPINEIPGSPIKNRLPEMIGIGVGLVAGITGASFEALSLVHRSERTYADWIMMSSWVTVITSSAFGLFRLQQSPKSQYALLEEGRIQPKYDQESLSQEIDALYRLIISNQSEESPTNPTDLEKLKFLDSQYRSMIQQQLSGSSEHQMNVRSLVDDESTPLLLQQTKEELARLTDQLDAVQSQKSQLEKKLETSMKLSEGYLQKLSPLEQENKKIKRELAEKNEEILSLKEDMEELERSNTNLVSEIAVLQEEIEKIELNFQGALNFNGTMTAEAVKSLGARLSKLKEISRSASGSASNSNSQPASPHKPTIQSRLNNNIQAPKVPDLGSKKEQ